MLGLARGLQTLLVVALLLASLGAQAPVGDEAVPTGKPGRTLVIGFDGLDGNEVMRRVAAGEMPAFAELKRRGALGPLATTEPAQSPVSWSTMITGLDPGRTGIDGFLEREFRDGEVRVRLSLGRRVTDREGLASRSLRRWVLGIPFLIIALGAIWQFRRRRFLGGGLAVVIALVLAASLWASERALPDGFPRALNSRRGSPYWERLDAAGIATATSLAPCSFPAVRLENGRLTCGFGVPDLQGTVGFWTLYGDDLVTETTSETGGRYVPVAVETEGGVSRIDDATLIGPDDLLQPGVATTTSLSFEIREEGDGARLTAKSSLGLASTQADGWTDPLPVEFAMSPFLKIRGLVRLRLVATEPALRIYADPVHFDPAHLPIGLTLSSPAAYAAELAEELGPWETTGWATATNALKDGALDEAGYLADAERVWDEQEALALHAINDAHARCITAVFSVPDRIQHMFTRYGWEERTLDGQPAPPEFRGAVDAAYRRADDFIGKLLADHLDEDDLLLVVSDHGFAPFRRSVNLNRFLLEEGLLVLKRETTARSLHENLRRGEALAEVDWERTKAYALGLGKIYLNREGREPRGIVADAEVAPLLERIEAALLALRDEGSAVVSSTQRGEAIYPEALISGGPADLYVGFHRGWRISWQACLGGAHEPLFSDNRSPWSGDHCGVDPTLVPGVIATNRPASLEGARVVDIAPTVLARFGLRLHNADGRALNIP